MKNKSVRRCELDIFRIVAITGVVLFHYTFRGFASDNMSQLSFPFFGAIFKYGYMGIYLFFMVSGYANALSSTSGHIKQFVISRICRLYPCFWIGVTLTSIVTLVLGGDRYHVSFAQYLVNLSMLNDLFGVEPVDGAYWFLFQIIKFYIFVVIILMFKLGRYQEYVAGIWLLMSIAIKITHLYSMEPILMPELSSFIVAGIIFCTSQKNGWNVYRYSVVICSLLFSIHSAYGDRSYFQQHYHTSISLAVIWVILSIFYLGFYLITLRHKLVKESDRIVLFGATTYPLYLIHQNVGFMIFNFVGGCCNKYLVLFLTFSLMASVAFVITKYVEPYFRARLRVVVETIISVSGEWAMKMAVQFR